MSNLKYNFELQIVEPVCSGTAKNWCPITERCESECAADFSSKMYSPNDADSLLFGPDNPKTECKIGTTIEEKGYCSNEQTCLEPLTCPKSFQGYSVLIFI